MDRLDDGSVRITWQSDLPDFEGHVSTYEPSFGQQNRNLESRVAAASNLQGKPVTWDRDIMSRSQLKVEYKSYMGSDSTLLSSLRHLARFGLMFIESIPASSDAVTSIANRIGPLRNTFYGSTWDVRSVPSAKNVAYTSTHLGFHMDLLYVDNPPGLQILHCIQASARGGESLFSDALRAVRSIEASRPDQFSILQQFPVTYHYHNNHVWYQQTRPHIEMTSSPHEALEDNIGEDTRTLQQNPTIKAINWSPPFQAPFLVNIGSSSFSSSHQEEEREDFCAYLDAIKHLKRKLEADEAIFETRLAPGTAVIFDNRRIVHARRAFENQGGDRWLKGAYIDTDSFRSRLRILREEG
ncbi:MAG: hypothetical protein Q9220_003277 [cf. Caloplaca sp. 1 TL-2023]